MDSPLQPRNRERGLGLQMSVGTAIIAAGVVLVGIEVLNVFLGLWSDRIADRLRRRLRQAPPKHPWTDRTGT